MKSFDMFEMDSALRDEDHETKFWKGAVNGRTWKDEEEENKGQL